MKLETLRKATYDVKIPYWCTGEELVALFNTRFARHPRIQFFYQPLDGINRNYCVVTGLFNVADDDYWSVWITFHAPKIKLAIPRSVRLRLLFDVFSTLAHEYVHQEQYQKQKACPRNYRHKDRLTAYYGQKVEIQAYALVAALEAVYAGSTATLDQYRQLFTPDHPRYKRFLKTMWKYRLTLLPANVINSPQGEGDYASKHRLSGRERNLRGLRFGQKEVVRSGSQAAV